MKLWQKIVSCIAFVAVLGLMIYSVAFGWGEDAQASAKNITLGLDLEGGVSVTYQAPADASSQDMDDVVYKMVQRVSGYDGASVYAEANNRVTIEIPGADDAEEVLDQIGKPGKLYFILEKTEDGETTNFTGSGSSAKLATDRTIADIEKDGGIYVTGSDIIEAEAVYNESDPVVSFKLNSEAATKFEEATKLAASKGWKLGIYYDDYFISTPTASKAIEGGSAIIEGMNSMEEARNLASYIRIGAMPVELEQISAQVVGASLGQEAIKTSLIAGAIGLLILFIFMIAYYRVPGIAANIALITYIGAMLLILNVFNLTLTLPGIAGIILGIGMAVDGNVVIYARIREEIATGRPINGAIKVGFRKALSAIIDGNVTTLIAAIILGVIGTGAIRGFALTLGIGIVLSMITSLLVARWALLLMYHLGAKKVSHYGSAKKTKTFDFVGKRKICFAISGLLIATGIAFAVINGATGNGMFNYELEFTGGQSTTVAFDKDYSLEEVEKEIIPVIKEVTGVPSVQQQKIKNDPQHRIVFKTAMLDEKQQAALENALEGKFNVKTSDSDSFNYTKIGGSISSEMKRDAIIAIVVATVCMLLYISIRFRDFRFALSAILALVHDVLIVLGFYAISRTGVGNTFIACMLTIVGYSINATIVIFDRIRENMKSMTKSTLSEVVNSSITSTLTRSINTSLTTFIMVLFLFILGVDSIKAFAAPIMVGIVIGGYSSVFISGALWFGMKLASHKRAVKKNA